MEKEYKGLQENLERFKNDLTDEKMRLLFSIAYKQGYDQALSIADISCQREQLLAFAGWLYGNLDKDVQRMIVDDYLKGK